MPILVREATPSQILELALVENIQRADLNAIEEALAYRQLAVEFGMKQAEIAERVGKSRPAIANALRLLSAPETSARRSPTMRSAPDTPRRSLQIEDSDRFRRRCWNRCIRLGLSVRETERLAQRATAAASTPRTTRTPRYRHARQSKPISSARSAQGRVARGKTGGRITISFHSDEELTAILNHIVGSDELDDY